MDREDRPDAGSAPARGADRSAPPAPWAHLAAVVLLLGGSIAATILLVLAAVAASSGAPRFALAGLAAAAACASLGLLPWWRARRRPLLIALAVSLTITLCFVLPLRAPRPALVRSVSLDGEDAGAPWFSAIPEREVVHLGAQLGLLPAERRWLPLLHRTYDAIEQGDAVDPRVSFTLDAWVRDRRHLWLAAPEGPGPFPLVVFLHGNGGPFHFYAHALVRPALARGFAIAFPTWGFGNWHGEPARARVLETIEAVARRHPIDRARLYLAGLSAGGLGVIELMARDPGPFRAAVAISGADGPPSLGTPPFGGRPLLVVHGAKDARFRVQRPRELVARARAAGGVVEYDEVAEGDHFIVLTHPRETVERLFEWLAHR